MTDRSPDFRKFVAEHLYDDTAALRLALSGKIHDFNLADALLQIDTRRKFARKFKDTLAACPDFFFPSMLSGEQATSDLLAKYHSGMIPEGADVADLTAGLGIDAMHIAARASHVVAVERNPELTEALGFNTAALGINNIEIVGGDCRDFIGECIATSRTFDCIFIDPARRAADGSRVFAFAGCEPDLTVLLPSLKKICRKLIIKASPMLDITAAVKSLQTQPARIIALGTPAECKELIFDIRTAGLPDNEPILEAVTLDNDGNPHIWSFRCSEESGCETPPCAPPVAEGNYIYDPYPSVMKSGPFKSIACRLNLRCFSSRTHLYYSDRAIDSFPGKRYRIEAILPYASRIIKRFAGKWPIAEVAVRNFGISADELRKKLSVRDGSGAVRVFGMTDSDLRRFLIVAR